MYNLKNSYESVGRTNESLVNEINEMEAATEYITVKPEELVILSYKGRVNDKEAFYVISAKTMSEGPGKGAYTPFITEALGEKNTLMDESIKEAGAVLMIKNRAYFVSPEGWATLAEKSGVGGDCVMEGSIFRDLLIMDRLLKKNVPLKICYRQGKGDGGIVRKVFAVLTEKYTPISMKIIPETHESFENDGTMGKGEMRYWKNTQMITEALVEFPEAAEELMDTYSLPDKFIPGIRILTSDTGSSSVRIQSTYRPEKGKTFTVQKDVYKKHMGEVTKEDIMEEAKKEIFPMMGELPKALAERLGTEIGTPDLSTEKGVEENRLTVQKAIRYGIRKLKIGAAIGRKRAKELSEQLCAEVNGTIIYTEYDIASMFMGVGDRIIGLPDNARKNLEKAVGEAPYISYQKESGEPVVLLPEEV